MVGEIFEIDFFKVVKNTLQSTTMVGENFAFNNLNWLKLHQNDENDWRKF